MSKNEKALIGGVIIGATLATVAICAFIKKCTNAVEVHLFNLENQDDAEDKIDELIPHEMSEASADASQEGDK